jgi:hypothetical protein
MVSTSPYDSALSFELKKSGKNHKRVKSHGDNMAVHGTIWKM